jgi:single-strand DNA-binding protein
MFGTLVGKIGGEIRKAMAGNTSVVNFSVGERKYVGQGKGYNGSAYDTVWWDVAFFGTRAEKVASFLEKGKLVAVSGDAGLRQFVHQGETKSRLEIKATEVQLLGDKSGPTDPKASGGSPQQGYPADDLPF